MKQPCLYPTTKIQRAEILECTFCCTALWIYSLLHIGRGPEGFWALRWSRNKFWLIISYFPPSKTCLEMKFADLWYLKVGVWNIPLLAFRIFFSWRPFWKCFRTGSASQIFPVNITDSYSIGCKLAEKYTFVNLREGCMMGLPRLQPTRLCMQAGQKSCFLGLFLRGCLTKF